MSAEPSRILHTMLRVGNLERSLSFYTGTLRMKLFRREDYPGGHFTLAFVGYGDESNGAVVELTYNWGQNAYEHGSAFGHIALAVADLNSTCARLEAQGVRVVRAPGPVSFTSPNRDTAEIIAFIEDPDGYRIELLESPPRRMP